ncbi:MAG: hypothetical protein LBR79_04780 [Oscillospiraceae bacterium]|jgi:hypothetical protein|nr:hypothetical protein [Oscillospiraceae bacterium]
MNFKKISAISLCFLSIISSNVHAWPDPITGEFTQDDMAAHHAVPKANIIQCLERYFFVNYIPRPFLQEFTKYFLENRMINGGPLKDGITRKMKRSRQNLIQALDTYTNQIMLHLQDPLVKNHVMRMAVAMSLYDRDLSMEKMGLILGL